MRSAQGVVGRGAPVGSRHEKVAAVARSGVRQQPPRLRFTASQPDLNKKDPPPLDDRSNRSYLGVMARLNAHTDTRQEILDTALEVLA